MLASAESFTVLSLGGRGVVDGTPFGLATQTLVRSEHGLWWTEWRLRLDDGRTRYLSESGGRFVLLEDASLLPEASTLVPGMAFDPGWIVTARGQARRVKRWGEPDAAPLAYTYAELTRAEELAVIEWPHAFRGRIVTLAALGLAPTHPLRLQPVPELSAPKDVGWLPIGAAGVFRGAAAEVIGCIARVSDDAAWEEYLVRTDDGLAWLVLADGAWSVLEPVLVGPTDAEAPMEATVTWAAGELPWEVTVGERSTLSEHHGITRELSVHGVTWSRAVPLATEDIVKSFGKRALPHGQGAFRPPDTAGTARTR